MYICIATYLNKILFKLTIQESILHDLSAISLHDFAYVFNLVNRQYLFGSFMVQNNNTIVFPSVWDIVHSLKLVYYLHVHAGKPL